MGAWLFAMRRLTPARAALQLAFLAAVAVPALAFGSACAGCARPGGASECASCPAEIRAVLEGKTRIVRRTPELPTDCLVFESDHPMLRPEGRERWSAPLDRAELAHAERYGRKRVVAAPACADRAGSLPSHVVFSRPLTPSERVRDDGSAKPIVRVDPAAPGCLAKPRAPQLLRGRAACGLRGAVEATRELGGVVIEIAGGTYAEPRSLRLGHGQVLVARNDEPVTVTGWVDLSRGNGPRRPWVRASDGRLGGLFVVDWSEHQSVGGSDANRAPLEIDGRSVPMAHHWEPGTRAPDVNEIALSTHDAGRDGPAFILANPGHPATCMDSGVNVKSKEHRCLQGGVELACSECRRRGTPVTARQEKDGICRAPANVCVPKTNWRTSKAAALDLCRRELGAGVSQCLVLKLPPGRSPADYRVRASNTSHGFLVYNDPRTQATGVVLRGLRLENFPVRTTPAERVDVRSGLIARLDGLELEATQVSLRGGHAVLENSHGVRGRLRVSSGKKPLRGTFLRNNVLERYYGKPIQWRDPKPGTRPVSPASLHGLFPLCRTCPAPTPGSGRPALFSGEEDFASWDGWNGILFNVIRHGSGINTEGSGNLVVVGNAFENGGVQEGIIELWHRADRVWVHHNWARDGIGTGVQIQGRVTDLVVTDNQLVRQPGRFADGAGTDRSAEVCARPNRPCDGSHYAILFQPKGQRCGRVTFANNLAVEPRFGGFAFHGCNDLTIRNNTVEGGKRPFLIGASEIPSRNVRLIDNVAIGPVDTGKAALSYWERGTHPFRAEESRGNYFEGCRAGGKGCPRMRGAARVETDRAWSSRPGASGEVRRAVEGWAGPDRCGASPEEAFRRPGFNDRAGRCVPASGAPAR